MKRARKYHRDDRLYLVEHPNRVREVPIQEEPAGSDRLLAVYVWLALGGAAITFGLWFLRAVLGVEL